MKKRILAGILAAIMLLSSAGCGPNPYEQGQQTPGQTEESKPDAQAPQPERLASMVGNVVQIEIPTNQDDMIAVLRTDGNVRTYGFGEAYAYQIARWEKIVKICSGVRNNAAWLAGLREDGTVVTTLEDSAAETWTDITDIFAEGVDKGNVSPYSKREYFLVGCQEDGNLVTDHPLCGGWTDIREFLLSESDRAVGLKADGTVIDSSNTVTWSGIADIFSYDYNLNHVYGRKEDGTIVGRNYMTAAEGSWKGIRRVLEIDYPYECILGCREDGTVVCMCMDGQEKQKEQIFAGWGNVETVYASDYLSVGLNPDGTLAVPNGKLTGGGPGGLILMGADSPASPESFTVDYLTNVDSLAWLSESQIMGACKDGTMFRIPNISREETQQFMEENNLKETDIRADFLIDCSQATDVQRVVDSVGTLEMVLVWQDGAVNFLRPREREKVVRLEEWKQIHSWYLAGGCVVGLNHQGDVLLYDAYKNKTEILGYLTEF